MSRGERRARERSRLLQRRRRRLLSLAVAFVLYFTVAQLQVWLVAIGCALAACGVQPLPLVLALAAWCVFWFGD